MQGPCYVHVLGENTNVDALCWQTREQDDEAKYAEVRNPGKKEEDYNPQTVEVFESLNLMKKLLKYHRLLCKTQLSWGER